MGVESPGAAPRMRRARWRGVGFKYPGHSLILSAIKPHNMEINKCALAIAVFNERVVRFATREVPSDIMQLVCGLPPYWTLFCAASTHLCAEEVPDVALCSGWGRSCPRLA